MGAGDLRAGGSRAVPGGVRSGDRVAVSGHIAGIVNPPAGKKAEHWVAATGAELPADPGQWKAEAERHQGSWWVDWVAWAKKHSGAMVKPPELPAGPPAPGRYVLDTA